MRMWMVNPRILCRKHLLGEHVEVHMTVGTLNLGRSIDGYLEADVLEPHNLESRHDALAAEMLRRGYNHHSPLPRLKERPPFHEIDRAASKEELLRRCPECRKRNEKYTKTITRQKYEANEALRTRTDFNA